MKRNRLNTTNYPANRVDNALKQSIIPTFPNRPEKTVAYSNESNTFLRTSTQGGRKKEKVTGVLKILILDTAPLEDVGPDVFRDGTPNQKMSGIFIKELI